MGNKMRNQLMGDGLEMLLDPFLLITLLRSHVFHLRDHLILINASDGRYGVPGIGRRI